MTATTNPVDKKDKDYQDDIIKRLSQSRMANGGLTVDPNLFLSPDMGDFLGDEMTLEYLQKVEKDIQDYNSDGYGALYYIENPVIEELGYHEQEKVFVITASPVIGKIDDELNKFDGDTMSFSLGSINDGGEQNFTLAGVEYNSVTDYLRQNVGLSDFKKSVFSLRSVGINSPEIPHYSTIPKKDTMKFIKVKYSNLKTYDANKYIFDKTIKRSDDTFVDMINLGEYEDKWHEVDLKPYEVETISKYDSVTGKEQTIEILKMVSSDSSILGDTEYHKQGIQSKNAYKNLLINSSDIRIILDAKSFNAKSGSLPKAYDDDFYDSPLNAIKHPWSQIQRTWNAVFGETGYQSLGYNAFGQDAYKRFLGAVYVKTYLTDIKKTVWVNVAKYMAANFNRTEVLPDYSSDPQTNAHYNFLSDAFRLWSYDPKNTKIMDALQGMSEGELDDRKSIQENITKINFEALKDHTVMIGDSLFMVPPTSIRVISQTTAERMPLLRARGSMTKSAPRTERLIEMTLFFNNEDGINGIPYDVNIKGKQTTYYMNGLRALLSMFKFTPFLPIDSNYINKTLNIDAVSLVNIKVSTTPGYPRCLSAVLTLQEFDYRVYMPELPVPNPETDDLHKNMFASTISFETMRWYYQRAIARGEKIKNLDFNSIDYMKQTLGNKTALQPMSFDNSNVEFFIVDKEHLDELLEIKKESMARSTISMPKVTAASKQIAGKLVHIFQALDKATKSSKVSSLLRNLNRPVKENGYIFPLRYKAALNISPNTSTSTLTATNVTKEIVSGQDSSYLLKNYINPIFNEIKNSLVNTPLFKGMVVKESTKTVSTQSEKYREVYWDILIDINRGLIASDKEIEAFMKVIAQELTVGNTTVDPKEMMEDGKIKVRFKAQFGSGLSGDLMDAFSFDTRAPGYQLLQYCSRTYDIGSEDTLTKDSLLWDSMPGQNMQDYISETKQGLDWETEYSYKFVNYPTGDIKIKSISAVFGNTISKLSVQSSDGYAPQYSGGQDTVIELSIETKDEGAVSLLNQLPTLAARYARDYRLVLNTWPIRINSEITRLLGVNEVIVDSVDISTVPGQPGLFEVNMRLMSVDRTLRNREALKKLDVASNAGSKRSSDAPSRTTKGFFDIKDTLSEAEIYPDLELPTVKELEENGFKFIRYSNTTSSRAYPDPDFYFIYSHVIGSAIFRQTILDFLKEQADGNSIPTFSLTDIYGGEIEIQPADQLAYKVTSKNSNAETVEKMQKDIKDATDYMTRKDKVSAVQKLSNYTYDEINAALSGAELFQTWNIADTIQCQFREKKYENVFNETDDGFGKELSDQGDKIIELINQELYSAINNPLRLYDRVSNTQVAYTDKGYKLNMAKKNYQSKNIEGGINAFVDDFFGKGIGAKIIDLLEVPADTKKDTIKQLKSLIYAAAASASGQVEAKGGFFNKRFENNWKPMMWVDSTDGFLGFDISIDKDESGELIPLCQVSLNSQGSTGFVQAANMQQAIDFGTAFGPFQIKQYTEKEIESILGITPTKKAGNGYFLDPYYNTKATPKEIEQYKIDIMTNPYSAGRAFTRHILVWMKKMLEDKLLLSLADLVQSKALEAIQELSSHGTAMSDPRTAMHAQAYLDKQEEEAKRQEAKKETEEEKTDDKKEITSEYYIGARGNYKTPEEIEQDNELKAKEKRAKDLTNEYKKIIEKNKLPLALGKFFAPMSMAILNGDSSLYSIIRSRDYEALNRWAIEKIMPSSDTSQNLDEVSYKFNKLIKALIGVGIIKDEGKVGSNVTTIGQKNETMMHESIYIEAAENPAVYITHSFYDMITNDKRGRMARAFPTFYMIFIDEGREIGVWKLHDNFYNMSAIGEIQVVKSRKIAADTATITMSNMFKTYTTEDEDARAGYDYDWKDAFTSIFSPRIYFKEEEAKRLQAQPVERTKLKPGVRIHIRMGYGSNASTLPILFNGTVSEVGTGEAIQIVAQGDGVELSNPILSEMDAEDIKHNDDFILSKKWKDWIKKGGTPREILGSLLTTKGGYMKKQINKYFDGRFFNDNPYGIVHFGEKDFKDIFKDGEVVQNIYEGSSTPSWNANDLTHSHIAEMYAMDGAPKISTHIFGKSYWDLMHICASASPDYIASIIPFQFRSSVFYGAPRYYVAYDYEKSQNNTVLERRKPFQQYHIYTSYSDIVGNTIKASDREVKTAAVGLYSSSGWLGKEKVKRVGPMWVDFDIYPEKQKTMTVDTQLLAKGSAAGDIIPFMNWMQNELADDQGKIQGGYALAWRMTATALKNSIKDMYQGELIVIGDPTVKPYDKVWLEDVYERMQGSFEVEAVVHNFSVAEGYTTSIYADCISCIDDRYEQVSQHITNNIVAKSVAAYGAIVLTSALFAGSTRPLLTAMLGYATKTGNLGVNVANNISQVLGKDGLGDNAKWLSKLDDTKSFFGISGTNLELDRFLARATNWRDVLRTIPSENMGDVARHYERMIRVYDDLTPDNLTTMLKDARNVANISPKDAIQIDKAIQYLDDAGTGFKGKINKEFLDAFKKVDAADIKLVNNKLMDIVTDPKLSNSLSNSDELMKIVTKFDDAAKLGLNSMDDVKDFSKAIKAVSEFSKNGDEVAILIQHTDDVYKTLKGSATLSTMTDEVIASKGMVAVLQKMGFGAGATLTATIVALALEMAIVYAITAFVNEYVERWMKNLQVLQIYPLKKDGKVLTAGLDGSKGVVVGSPTADDPGLIEGWLGKMLDDRPGDGLGTKTYNLAKNILLTSDMRDIASKFRKRNGLPDMSTMTGRESVVQGLLMNMAADEMKTVNHYRSAVLKPRINNLTTSNNQLTEEAKDAFRKLTVQSNDKIEMNPKITEEMIPLTESIKIKEMINKNYVILAHSLNIPAWETDNTGFYTGHKNFTIEEQKISVPIIYEENTDKTVIDAPFLRPDAYAMLVQILERLEEKFDKPSSQYGDESLFKKHPVIIKSALRIGDKWASTGLIFRMQVTGYKDFNKLLGEMETEQNEIYKRISADQNKFFNSKKISDDTYDIMVLPPK